VGSGSAPKCHRYPTLENKPTALNPEDETSVLDPDPRVFWPPGSGCGSGSFYHHTKICNKKNLES